MSRLLLLAILCLAPSAQAQIINDDAWISGRFGAGTTDPTARLEVQASSLTTTVFQVSGVDQTPFLAVYSSGAVGMGQVPQANLDLFGSPDDSSIGLQLKSGNLFPGSGSYQIAFGQNGTTDRRHAIRTIHSVATSSNSIDFLIWEPGAGAASNIAVKHIASLVTTTATAGVHIMPIAALPDAALEVSNGSSLGGGDVICASEQAPSSRRLKSHIAYFTPDDEAQALEEVGALKHAAFRYMSFNKKKGLVRDKKQRLRRGLIFEESPASIRGEGQSLVVDERLVNAEMAFKELARQLEALEKEFPSDGGVTP